ncbi:MAG: hypothetical protein KatS3mg095_0038 [Candidatus Parcubacteria bacterium]|nr:MAG: hypothetical protein KatS3mg095_0038 [Candidatus Parcubacteria bacterium]
MFSHFTQPIIKFFSNLAYYSLIFAILFSVFSLIYLGIKIYTQKKNYQDLKISLFFIILGILILGIIFIRKEIIFDLINLITPKF